MFPVLYVSIHVQLNMHKGRLLPVTAHKADCKRYGKWDCCNNCHL